MYVKSGDLRRLLVPYSLRQLCYLSVNEKERVINLGSLVGKLTTGSGTITGFKEDKRNRITPGKNEVVLDKVS